MGLNPMESAGCFSIIKALQKNPETKLELIDACSILNRTGGQHIKTVAPCNHDSIDIELSLVPNTLLADIKWDDDPVLESPNTDSEYEALAAYFAAIK